MFVAGRADQPMALLGFVGRDEAMAAYFDSRGGACKADCATMHLDDFLALAANRQQPQPVQAAVIMPLAEPVPPTDEIVLECEKCDGGCDSEKPEPELEPDIAKLLNVMKSSLTAEELHREYP